MVPRRPSGRRGRRTLGNLIQRPAGRLTWRYDPVLASSSPARNVPTPEQWAIFARMTCPTLILRGQDSALLRRATAERMAREIPDGRLIELPDYGHGISSGNAAGVLAAVRAFPLAG
jgi:pimeloyl-ACP methyl ester carboxylesterase